MSLLNEAVTVHVARLQSAAGELVTLRYGEIEITGVTAVRGQSDFDDASGDGEVTVTQRSVDFLIAPIDLIDGEGVRLDPSRGLLIEPENALGEVYETMPGVNTAPSNWNDGRQNLHRIHTVRRVKS